MKSLRFLIAVLFFVSNTQGQDLRIFEKGEHYVTSVCFSPDNRFIASGGTDHHIVVWDVGRGVAVNVLEGHQDIILSIAFSKDGKYIVSGSKDKSIIFWSVEKGKLHKRISHHKAAVTSVVFSADDKYLISGSADHSILISDVESGNIIKEIKDNTKEISSVAVSPDGTMLAASAYDGSIKIWNMADFELQRTFNPNVGKSRAVSFSMDSKLLAGGFDDGTVKIFDISSQTIVYSFFIKSSVYDLEFSPDGKYLSAAALNNSVKASPDNIVKIWDLESGDEVKILNKFFNLLTLAYSPNSKLLATAELNSKIKIWNLSDIDVIHSESGMMPGKKRKDVGQNLISNVGNAAPVIEIVQPKINRGTSIICLEKELVIKGVVKSQFPIYEMRINEAEVSMDETNKFTHHHKLSYGKNNITIKVIDKYNHATEESFVVERQVKIAKVNDTISRQGMDYALIIATDEYENFSRLSNPVFDGTAIAEELEKTYNFKTDVVKNPDRSELFNSIRNYSKRQFHDDDQLIIFIAGHGEFDKVFSEGYLVTKDSKKGDEVKASYIAHSALRTIINNIPCKHILLVMDVCYGGTFDQFVASNRGDIEYSDIDKVHYIRRKMELSTRRYLTSGGNEYVPDGRPGYHSPFARKILEGLRNYGGQDKVLTFNELFQYVEKAQPGPKTGEFGNNQPGSDFLFISK